VTEHLILRNAQGEQHRFSDTASLMGWLGSQRGVVSAFPLQVLDGGAEVPLPAAALPSIPSGRAESGRTAPAVRVDPSGGLRPTRAGDAG